MNTGLDAVDDITIRPFATVDEREECLALQRETWGQHFTEAVPPSLLLVSEKLGGVAAGAFTSANELVGFVFGLTGVRDGVIVHWSDMLAVRPAWRNRGLGQRLKHYQRERARAAGAQKMYWSFEPLEAKNAYFNINRLGVRVEEYVRNMYGSGEASRLHQGIGTDRFVVVWELTEAGGLTSTANPAEDPRYWTDTPNVSAHLDSDGPSLSEADVRATAERIRVEVPASIQSEKQTNPERAVRWREVTRQAFEHFLGSGYAVVGFWKDEDSGRCYYLLRRKPN